MRHRSPLRPTSGSSRSRQFATRALFFAMALLPSLWVSWQGPTIRGVVLPALAILALLLLLPRREPNEAAQPGEHKHRRSAPLLRTPGRADLAELVTSIVQNPSLLYLAWAVVCAARAARSGLPGAPEFARGELLRLTAGVSLYLVVGSLAARWEDARQVVDALLWAAVSTTVVAFVTHRPDDPALIGPFGNPQLMAAVLLLLAPFALVVGTAARDGARRIVAQVAAVLALAALALAQTRSAWAGAFVAMAALAALLHRMPSRRSRRRGRRSGWLRPAALPPANTPPLAAGLLALAALAWLVCHSDLAGPVSARAATLTRLSDDEGATWRLRQWRVALCLAREHPLAGNGLGSFPLAAAPRLPQPIPLAMARAVGPNLSLNAHSYYLQALAETGFVGLGLYLWTLARFLYAGLRAWRRRDSPFRSLLLVASLAAIAGQSIDALANPAYSYAEVSLFFWAILGLGSALAHAPLRSRRPSADGIGEAEATPAGAGLAGRATPSLHGTPSATPPLPYPLRLAAALTGAGVLAAGAVAGAPPPNQPEYLPLKEFRVVALTTPGYLLQTLLPGECVEMRGRGTLNSNEERDTTEQCSFARAGGTAPAGAIEQMPAPHANLFCVPTNVPPECDGCTVTIQGTFSFNGQTMTAMGPPLRLSVPRAAPETLVTATPRVIPPSGEMVEIQVRYVEGALRFQRLWKVDADEALEAGDVQIVDDTHVRLRAASTVPGRRIYTLRYQFHDRRNRTWLAPVQIYVR